MSNQEKFLESPPSFDSLDIGVQCLDCGREPRIDDYATAERESSVPLIDYSHYPESTDQCELNAWLANQEIDGRAILHIGAGNSSLARIVCHRARMVTAVTVSENERQCANNLALPNYSCFLVNKYSSEFSALLQPTRYDFVIDNNIASYACCRRHVERYLRGVSALLQDRGALVTHWLGMQWIMESRAFAVDPAWRISERTLGLLARAVDLEPERQNNIFVLRPRSSI